ncbi:hypothetical protein S7711_11475 [Stachybotrys chartarum IBT 7711]|uniref:Uncharacterized protein n=1 Tax=Stachybotrys chartarum (strain CBS 109288 / IBT 7711) TaxID=1280523 RepID=A0A084B820_STACB|nr:hypothetical protein S7711_11475 [Stachybotrys chartarum IBT 7711]
MASPIPTSIPIRVFLASLQEYGAYLCQWQAHVEAQSREAQSLRDRISALEKEAEDLKDCRDVLEQMVDTQRELMRSLEADLIRASGERQGPPFTCKSNGLTSCIDPLLKLGPTDTNSYAAVTLLPSLDPTGHVIQHKRMADIDIGSSPKRMHCEESAKVGVEQPSELPGN